MLTRAAAKILLSMELGRTNDWVGMNGATFTGTKETQANPSKVTRSSEWGAFVLEKGRQTHQSNHQGNGQAGDHCRLYRVGKAHKNTRQCHVPEKEKGHGRAEIRIHLDIRRHLCPENHLY